MLIILQVILSILIADFLSGLCHWAEDNYGEEHWPIIGKAIIVPNIAHHFNCRNFVHNSWFFSARELLVIGGVILLVAHAFGVYHWMLLVAVVIGINANEIHKWSHRSKKENGRIITTLQKLRLVQSPRHHFKHHKQPYNSNYCVVTNVMNPVLDKIKFWRVCEFAIYKTIGVSPRDDSDKKLADYVS